MTDILRISSIFFESKCHGKKHSSWFQLVSYLVMVEDGRIWKRYVDHIQEPLNKETTTPLEVSHSIPPPTNDLMPTCSNDGVQRHASGQGVLWT